MNLQVGGGYMYDFLNIENNDLKKAIWHIETDWSWTFLPRNSLSLLFRHEQWNEPHLGNDHYFSRGTLLLSYDYGSMLSIGAAFEYDTQMDKTTVIYTDPNDPDAFPPPSKDLNIRNYFYWAQARIRPLSWLDIRVLGGYQRGGVRCIAGLCRTFPNFAGVKAEIVMRY